MVLAIVAADGHVALAQVRLERLWVSEAGPKDL